MVSIRSVIMNDINNKHKNNEEKGMGEAIEFVDAISSIIIIGFFFAGLL